MRYELDFSQKKYINGEPVYRIKALQTFLCKASLSLVHAGDHGGWMSESSELYQDGTAWVFDDSVIHGDVRIRDDAAIDDRSIVNGKTVIEGSAYISGSIIEDSSVGIGSGRVAECLISESSISASHGDMFECRFKESQIMATHLSCRRVDTHEAEIWCREKLDGIQSRLMDCKIVADKAIECWRGGVEASIIESETGGVCINAANCETSLLRSNENIALESLTVKYQKIKRARKISLKEKITY